MMVTIVLHSETVYAFAHFRALAVYYFVWSGWAKTNENGTFNDFKRVWFGVRLEK